LCRENSEPTLYRINMMKRLLLSTLVIFFAFSGLAQSECGELLDSDQNGFITVLDLMNLLSYFGDSDSDLDGIFDSADACTDVSACNYLANPTVARPINHSIPFFLFISSSLKSVRRLSNELSVRTCFSVCKRWRYGK